MAAARIVPKSKSADKQKPSELAFAGRVQHVTMKPVEVPAKSGVKKTAPKLAPFITEVGANAGAAAGGAAPAAAAAAAAAPQAPSSFPHLTHENVVTKRAAHVTSARFVTTIAGPGAQQRIDVLERFHQDDVPGAVPKRDRFIGADADTGQVHAVTAGFAAAKHLPKKYRDKSILDRGNALDKGLFEHLAFAVGAADDKAPPLSPRSRRRELPDTGY